MSETTTTAKRRLFIPALGRIYAGLHDAAETLLRIVAGLALVTHGATKIVNPFGATETVEASASIPAR